MTKLSRSSVAAFVLFAVIAACYWSRPFESQDHSTKSSSRRLRQTINFDQDNLEGKIVLFLDIDGVIAPYGLDPIDDDAEDDASHFEFDDDVMDKLQNRNCWRNFTDDTMGALSKILEAFPASQTRVVLSSYWRTRGLCRISILEKFQDYGERHGGPLQDFRFFYGRTGKEQESRQAEIASWLLKYNPGDAVLGAWVVLDDQECLRGWENKQYRQLFMGHVVKPFEDIGLTEQNADKAIEILNEQLGES